MVPVFNIAMIPKRQGTFKHRKVSVVVAPNAKND